MSLVEVLPTVHALSRADKLRLIQLLAQELAEREAGQPIEPNRTYPVWSPDTAFDAAAALLRALEAEKRNP